MKRALLIGLCSTIVAAFSAGPAAAIEVSEDVPVRGGTAAVARTLGLDVVPDHGRFVAELTRVVDDLPRRQHIAIAALLQPLDGQPAIERVPVPLTSTLWSTAIFHRPVAPADLLFAILGDRRAALLCHALAALDDETLAYLTAHPAVLTSLYEEHAAVFGAFGDSLRVRGDRVITPGGGAAVPLWEAAVGESPSRAARFIAALFTVGDGRIAYLYETIALAGADHAKFALGLWMPDPAVRLERMAALTVAWSASFRDWRVKTSPFARQPNDAASVLLRVRVDPRGVPASPGSRTFWSHVFANGASAEEASGATKAPADERPIDAAWIIDATVVSDLRYRADRFDQITFAQRAFAAAGAADLPDVLVAVRAVPRYRMLMWTLERMGVRKAATFAAASRRAERLSALDHPLAFVATAQFQGALVLLHRMARVGTLEGDAAERLVAGLAAVPLDEDGRYGGAIVEWLGQALRPALSPSGSFERTLIAALSGPPSTIRRPVRPVRWEGQDYVFDLAAAERRRIARVRERQGSVSIDVALDLRAVARTLAGPSVRADGVISAVARLKAVVEEMPPFQSDADRGALPPGVDPRPDVRGAVMRILEELDRMAAAKNLKRLGRVSAELTTDADEVAAEALMSLAYALDLGDPDGPALLAGDVSRRHDFGLGSRGAEIRLRTPWMLPQQDILPGLAWHVDGSLLGLDVALARLALHRLGMDLPSEAPTLSSNQRETFVVSAALMNPFALEDSARDAIAAAIGNGRRRTTALVDAPDGIEAVADAIGMDGWRRRAARWAITHEPDVLGSFFSLGELVVLGGISPALNLQPWGMSAIATSGCLCSEMAPPGRWRSLTGRPQVGVMATAVPDLHLHVARLLNELDLPAGLATYVVSGAVQDFVDETHPLDADDWLSLVRRGQAISRERVEDYVAAAVADGPLLPVDQ